MNVKQSFKLAIKSLMVSKVRALLTMLGIIIGVAAVIIIVSMGNGMTDTMMDVFEGLGTNLIMVNVSTRGNRVADVDAMYEIANAHPDIIRAITPAVQGNGTLKNGSDNVSSSVMGISEDYLLIKSADMKEGRFLSYIDVERRSKVCAIGTYVSEEIFDNDPIGKTLRLNGENFIVVGVVDELANSADNSDDDMVYIPYTIASTMTNTGIPSAYQFSATSEDASAQVRLVLEDALFEIYENDDSYFVMSMAETLSEITALTDTFVTVLTGIAAISLLVGGIGIMNIMLVSVTERTKEIGVRKSLGARQRDIMGQFVIEAATTSAIGGIIGIGLGTVCANFLTGLYDINSGVTLEAIAVSFGVSVAIGIIFGYLPANKAAKLNPIDALRFE